MKQTRPEARYRIALTAAALGTLLLLPACASNIPASLGGLQGVFRDPGFAVQGKTRKDQAWISETQEAGIRVLGWKRPPRMKQNVSPLVPASTPLPPKKPWWKLKHGT